MRKEKLGPVKTNQLTEMIMKYWSEECVMVGVNKTLESLKITAGYSSVRVPILNEDVVEIRKIMPFHKRVGKRLSDIQMLVFAVSSFLEIPDELTLTQNENRPPNLRKVMGHTVDSVVLMGREQNR